MEKALFVGSVVVALVVLGGCSNDSGGTPGAGGTGGTGGSAASGGTPSGGTSSGGTSGSGETSGSGGSAGAAGSAGSGGTPVSYDATVLADGPVAYWAMTAASNSEPDLTGNGHTGSYRGSTPTKIALPNGELAASFDGASGYMTVPSSPAFSIPTTGSLAFEAWISPSVLQFPHDEGSGYVDWMGKCEQYSPTCEWEARLYDENTQETPNRPNRLSAYVFNPTAGLGSGADWQPSANTIQTSHWYHVVGQYTTKSAPSDCQNTATYPGSIDIWVNGVEWDHSSHGQTGCFSQYSVVPEANDSALDVGTMTTNSFFYGAIGKVAIYDHLLDGALIKKHYTAMTGLSPTGSCASTCSF